MEQQKLYTKTLIYCDCDNYYRDTLQGIYTKKFIKDKFDVIRTELIHSCIYEVTDRYAEGELQNVAAVIKDVVLAEKGEETSVMIIFSPLETTYGKLLKELLDADAKMYFNILGYIHHEEDTNIVDGLSIDGVGWRTIY